MNNKPKVELSIDRDAIKKLKLVVVAYSEVVREMFPTEDAYHAEYEVIERAQEIIKILQDMGINAKGMVGDAYFMTNLLVDKPDLVINLVDTVKGKDGLSTTIPAALELMGIRYTGAGMNGMVIGNNRNMFKDLMASNGIPTPEYKFIKDGRTKIPEDFPTPIIIKLNESGGSVGIDNHAVKETIHAAQNHAEDLLKEYKIPVIAERFEDGPEVTAIVFDDGNKKHVMLAVKKFGLKPDGKHNFTSLDSYEYDDAYHYKYPTEELEKKIAPLAAKAFDVLRYKDYAKFDIRVNEATNTPLFIDANPNTAFGPSFGLPIADIAHMYGVTFKDMLESLLSKHAKQI